MNDMLIAILSGGVTVAIIEGIREALRWRRERKAVKEDRAEEQEENRQKKADLNIVQRLSAIEKKTDALSEAIRYMLFDRIRYLGQAYIDAGTIDFDDRRMLNKMYNSYQGLDGDGDLATLMAEVNGLPLKTR